MKKMTNKELIAWVAVLLIGLAAAIAFDLWMRYPTKEKYEKCRLSCADLDAPSWSYTWHGCTCGGPTN